MTKGAWVNVVVDGEIHEGEITRVLHKSRQVWVKIPFYYSLSEKNGKVVKDNNLTVVESFDMVM